MPEEALRIIIDNNILISHLISGVARNLGNLILSKKIRIVYSNELIEEFIQVSHREKFRKYFTLEDVESIIYYLDLRGEFWEDTFEINICRDPKDDYLLGLAISSKADYLLTGDKDLLELNMIDQTKIISLKEFSDIIV